MSDQRPTWLVTGARGFLGANLGLHLGHAVRRVGAVRDTSAAETASTFDAWVSADLEHPESLAQWIREHRPEVIVHAAAMATHEGCETQPDLAHRVNAESAETLASAAQDAASRFILISTDAVFDGQRGHYTEEDEPSPFSVYGRTKLEGERLTLSVNPDALVVRTNFFGWSPSGTRSILEFFVNELRAGHRVRGFTDFTVTSAYVGALCETLHDLAATEASGVLHVTSRDALTKYEFGVAVAEEFGLDPALIIPTKADVDPPRNRDLSLNLSKVEGLLGRDVPTQRAGIARARQLEKALRAAFIS